jgi:hypothetical protein
MTKLSLLINFIGRSVNWAIALAIALTGLYLVAQLLLPGSFFGLVFIICGLLMGLLILIGGFNGIALWVITVLFFWQQPNGTLYRRTLIFVAIMVSFILSFGIFYLAYLPYPVIDAVATSTRVAFFFAFVASASFGYATLHLSNWYLKRFAAVN